MMANNTTIFTPEETLVILETARRALSDADIFDELAGDHDIADDQLKALQEKLQHVMDDNYRDEIQLDTRESGETLELDGECANDYRFTDKMYSESQDQASGGKGYWSKTSQCWTDITEASRFSAEDRLAFTPSSGAPIDARWRLVAQLDTVTHREVESLLFQEEIKQAA